MNSNLIKKFDKNAVIFRESEPGDEMFIVHAGKVRLVKRIESKIETLTILDRGDFFGEMAVIDASKPRTATAIVEEDGTEIITVDRKHFEGMLQGNVEIAIRMIKQYSERLSESNLRLEKLLREQQALDSGIQDILSNVRRKSDVEDENSRNIFGSLQSVSSTVKFPLKRPEVLIGRRDSNSKFIPDIDLTDLDQHRTVSRRHARLMALDYGVFVFEEPGVVNGTLVNGLQVEQGKVFTVHVNDRLQFGQVEFILMLQNRK